MANPQIILVNLRAGRCSDAAEGLFLRGNVPALLMVMPYTSIQFTVLHKLKSFASGSTKTEDCIHLSPYLSFLSGALSGCAATLGSSPFDLLRKILASQGEPKVQITFGFVGFENLASIVGI